MDRTARKRVGAWALVGMSLVLAARAAFAGPEVPPEEADADLDLALILAPQGGEFHVAGKRFLLPAEALLGDEPEPEVREVGEEPANPARPTAEPSQARPAVARTAPIARAAPRAAATRFAWPVRGRLTSRFGIRRHPITKKYRYHLGIDIAAPTGTAVRTVADGKVVHAGWKGGYGYFVEIDHGGGIRSRYGHNSKLLVHSGERVTRGQTIAKVGSTGHSTGPHLHFEFRRGARPVNPARLLP